MLWGITEPVLFFGAVIAFLVVLEIGFRIGRHHRKGRDDAAKAHFNAVQSALLSLLALLLGFNFAMAASRFEARKSLIQEEVDAINTTYLRAQLLPASQREGVTNLLRAYVDSRIEFLHAGTNDALLEKANVDASRIVYQLWQLTSFMMSQDASGASKSLFVQSLNDMINVNERRRAALDNHVPEVVIHLLFTVAVVALGFIAYGYGLSGRRRHGSTAIFALMIALVLTTILDLDQPRSGLIRVGEESILRLKAALDQNRL